MDGASLRQQVLSNNIANVDTPNFKAQDVNFYSQLKGMMDEPSPISGGVGLARTNTGHLAGTLPTSSPSPFRVNQADGQVRPDGNSVNIDVESAKVAENNIYYGTLATSVARKYKLIARAITKGGE
jgi:flagellar basal-body rod protein FlgB